MTDTATDKDIAEPFWVRVSAALAAMRPVAANREPAYEQPSIVRTMGMRPKLGARIDEELAEGWAVAATRHVSLSLLLIEVDRMSDYFADRKSVV